MCVCMVFTFKKNFVTHTHIFPGDIPNPVFKPRYPALQVDSLPTELSYICHFTGDSEG